MKIGERQLQENRAAVRGNVSADAATSGRHLTKGGVVEKTHVDSIIAKAAE
jgi:hypothetical protein